MPLNILIQTVPRDLHTLAVAASLLKYGADIYLSVGPRVPSSQSYSIYPNQPDTYSVKNDGVDICTAQTPIDIVWNRRSKMYDLQGLHPDDQATAAVEFDKFIFGFWCVAYPDAKWINPWQSSYFADYKLNQLSLAVSIGMAVSPTLYSNTPEDILAFIAQHGPENTIYKPHLGVVWNDTADPLCSSTTRVADFDYNDPEALQSCPGIYQRYIEKQYELRVTVMGSQIYAVKILPDGEPNDTLDWRADQQNCKVEMVEIPQSLKDLCHSYMKSAGLIFGCFDFIKNMSGEYVFLEVNEMGQFLWIEMLNPELTYLDHFIDFLYETADKPRPASVPFRLADIQASPEYAAMMERIAATDTAS